MKRGPKPVNVVQLRDEADLLAFALYSLRYGRPGVLTHLKGGVWLTCLLPEISADEIGYPEKVRQRILAGQMRYHRLRHRETMFAVPPTKKELRKVLELVRRNKNWSLTPPVFPLPEIWKRVNEARSAADVREVARRLRRYPLLASILHSHGEDFLKAKRLHNYPKSERPSSDNKRIQFLAKVLAGLKLGIAPATATKRLAHFRYLGYDPRRNLQHSQRAFDIRRKMKDWGILTGSGEWVRYADATVAPAARRERTND